MNIRFPAAFATIAVAAIVVAAAYWWQQPALEQTVGDASTIRSAVILNLTGPAARFDAPKQKTIEIAQERIKDLYPGVSLDVRIFDGGSGPEGATVAVRQASAWGAQYFLSGTSPTALAIAAQVRGRQPPVAQIANAANPEFGPPRVGEYRFWPDWKQEAALVADLLMRENLKKVLLIYSADPYSEALRKELQDRVAANDFTVTELQYDPASTPDFRPALIRAEGGGAQAVVVFGLPPGLTALVNQMSEVKWSGTTVGGVNINMVVNKFDEAGLKGPLWLVETEAMIGDPPKDLEVSNFRRLYRDTFGESPAFYTVYLADALYFIAAGASLSDVKNATPVQILKGVRVFDSASGTIRVLDDGTLSFVMNVRRAR